jgi:hypothetical protein
VDKHVEKLYMDSYKKSIDNTMAGINKESEKSLLLKEVAASFLFCIRKLLREEETDPWTKGKISGVLSCREFLPNDVNAVLWEMQKIYDEVLLRGMDIRSSRHAT